MTIVWLHAGMPKTGSTSIQEWLKLQSQTLRETHGITVVEEVGGTDPEPYALAPLRSGFRVYANVFLLKYAAHYGTNRDEATLLRLVDEFAEAVDRAASEFGDVLVTSEGFSALFFKGEEPFLRALAQVARRYEVRVAYYVRPQHTALEARWREWGFRNGVAPSEWVANESGALHYWTTFQTVRRLAPGVRFDVRPFRKDLLAGQDVVFDFATQFLGIDEPTDTAERVENPGIPIDLVNLLRSAPPELLDLPAGPKRPWRQGDLGPISQRWHVPMSEEAGAARELLRRYAFAMFEPGNRRLIQEFEWPTDEFVTGPAPEDDLTSCEALLTDLDRLWAPGANETALGYLYAVLGEMWDRRGSAP